MIYALSVDASFTQASSVKASVALKLKSLE